VAGLCAWIALTQVRERVLVQARLAAAERTAAEAAAAAAAEQQQDRAGQELASLREANSRLAEKVLESRREALAAAPSAAASSDAGPPRGDALARVLNEPEMKDTMRLQASNEVQRVVRQLVTTNLLQRLGLAGETKSRLQDLVTRRGMLGFEFMMPVMTGELDAAGLAESGRRTKAALAGVEEQIRTLLGEDGYRTFQWQDKSQPERERVAELSARLAEGGEPLAAGVQEQLSAAMDEERARFQFTTDYSDTSQIDFEHFHEFYAPEKMAVYFDELGELNERVLARARALLTPEQANELGAALTEHLRKSKYVIKTTNALFNQRPAR